MEADFFKKIGLTQGETKVYLALLKIGETTVGSIGRESKVSKSKMYDLLDKLIDKGLVNYIICDGVKRFSPNSPQSIIDLVMKQEYELNKTKIQAQQLAKELRAQEQHKPIRIAEIIEGVQGLKAIREELLCTLAKGDEFLVLGAPRVANEKWEAWFLDFHKRREAQGIGMRIIYNSNAREYGEKRRQFRKTQVRYLTNNMISPVWLDIYTDAVLFVFTLHQTLAIVIRNKELAQSFKAYFDIIWQTSAGT